MDIAVDLQPDGYWHAIDRNTYDCDCDDRGYFPTSPVGYGKTKEEAIADLMEKVAE